MLPSNPERFCSAKDHSGVRTLDGILIHLVKGTTLGRCKLIAAENLRDIYSISYSLGSRSLSK